eukprot:jgi/Mesen1/7648/ME000004S07912
MALGFASDPLACLEDLRSRFGGAVGFKLAGERLILISNPELAKQVLVTSADIFVKEGTAFFPGSRLAGNGLLVSDGDTWRRQRRLSNPAFRKAAVDSYAEAMVDVTQSMVRSRWRRGGLRDIYADFNDLTMEIVATALFGSATDGNGDGGGGMKRVGPAITTAFTFFAKQATSMLAVPDWVPTPDNIQYNAAVSELDAVVYDFIGQRRRQLAAHGNPRGPHGVHPEAPGVSTDGQEAPKEQSGGSSREPRRSDLLTRLLQAQVQAQGAYALHSHFLRKRGGSCALLGWQARDEDGLGMDDVALRDELMTLLVAETSAILLSWACTLLATHPDVQHRLAEEIAAVVGERAPTHADVPNLK